MKYPTLTEMIDQLANLVEQEKADKLTAIIGCELIERFSQNFAKEVQYGIVIDRTCKTLSIMEQNAAVVHFYKAAEKADIQPDQIPDDIEIRYEEYNDYCTYS